MSNPSAPRRARDFQTKEEPNSREASPCRDFQTKEELNSREASPCTREYYAPGNLRDPETRENPSLTFSPTIPILAISSSFADLNRSSSLMQESSVSTLPSTDPLDPNRARYQTIGVTQTTLFPLQLPPRSASFPDRYPYVQLVGEPNLQFVISHRETGPHWYFHRKSSDTCTAYSSPASLQEEVLIEKVTDALRPRILSLLRVKERLFPETDSGVSTYFDSFEPRRRQREYSPKEVHEQEYRKIRRSTFLYLRRLRFQRELETGRPHCPIPDSEEENIPLVVDLENFESDRPQTELLRRSYRDAILYDRHLRIASRRSARISRELLRSGHHP